MSGVGSVLSKLLLSLNLPKRLQSVSLLLTLALCMGGFPALAQERSYMEPFSVDQGLPHTDVFATVQDNDGFIWIGTSSGLCRYDGVEIRTYDISNSILESSRISSLYLAGDGLLYIGTEAGGLTLYDTADDRFVKTVKVPSNCVNSVFSPDDGGRVYICTNDGLSKLERDDDGYNVTSWSFGAVVLTGCSLSGDEMLVGTSRGVCRFSESEGLRVVDNGIFATSHLALDDGRLLLTSYEGIFIYNPGNDGFEKVGSFESRSVCRGGSGDIYVGTMRNGVLHYSSGLEVLNTYSPSNSGFSCDVSALLYDRSSVLWIGTIGKGCFRSNAYSRAFHLYPLRSDSQQQVVTMASDSRHRLWVSYKDGTVAVLENGKLTFLDMASLSMFASMPVSAIWEAPDGDVWLGSWDHGAGVMPAADVDAALSGGRFRLKRPYGLPERISIYRFTSDRFSSVWMTTASGVFRSPSGYLKGDNVRSGWLNLRNNYRDTYSLSDDFTTDIMVDDMKGKSVVWVGSRAGLNRIVCDEEGKICELRRVHVVPDKGAVEFISFIHKDRNGSMWVSALGLGLGKLIDSQTSEALSFRLYNKSTDPDFPDNEFESLQEDGNGNFWIGGHGLIRFNPSDGAIRCFSRGDGLQSNSFKIWDSADMGDGRLAFGGIGGFNVFIPNDISDIGEGEKPKVNLTGFTAGGQPVVTKGGAPVRRMEDVTLDSKRSSLVFRFAVMSYSAPERNRYRYMLEGLDDGWHEATGANPSASYPNVRPGRYSFMVYGADSNGAWASAPARVAVRIRPPWYLSGVAVGMYALALLLAAWGIFSSYKRRSDRKHREDVERKLHAEQQERNEEELKFHTDFLHEIKTPLTLITTPVEELLQNPNLGKNTLSRLRLVDQSAKILQKQIESITDLRKYDNGALRLHVVETDFSRFVEEICLLFQPVAKSKGIEFEISTEPLGEKVFMDKNQIEKVILNLLSNAIKYSPEQGGLIKVHVCEAVRDDGCPSGVRLEISNLGIGILPEDLPHIFDRFTQGRNNDRGGMGIGLAISKHAVLSHSGTIEAESVPGGTTVFKVFLPYGDGHFPADVIDRDYRNSDYLSNYDPLSELTDEPRYNGANGVERDYQVLVVDDSQELREYLVQLLSTRYNIITAQDGQEGYEKALSETPDLILTDVVMPNINGLELCQKIKENNVTSHIPVILISARDLPMYKMEGYRLLADDYITKPFHADMLLARIDSLIRQRESLRQSFRKDVSLEPSSVTATPVDEKFIRSCIENIEEHISDPDYGVDDLCVNIGYSRPQLYRKIKSITGMTAIQFVRGIRLKRAAQLLSSDPGKSVSQVMYAVGFNNISYFSKIFFAEFGALPKDYKSVGKGE